MERVLIIVKKETTSLVFPRDTSFFREEMDDGRQMQNTVPKILTMKRFNISERNRVSVTATFPKELKTR